MFPFVNRRMFKISTYRMARAVFLGFIVHMAANFFTYAETTSAQTDAKTIDNLVLQWQQIEQQRSQLSSHWRQKKQLLEQQLSLLDDEAAALTELLKNKRSSTSETETERQELLAQQSNLENEQSAMTSQLAQAKASVLGLVNQLPPPLQQSWQPHIDNLRLEDASASDQLTHIVEAIKKLHAFNQRIVVNHTTMTFASGDSSQTLQVSEIYLGTNKGWFIAKDNSHWGMGQPEAQGWQWQKNNDPAIDPTRLRALVTSLESPAKAEFISLPLTISTGDQ